MIVMVHVDSHGVGVGSATGRLDNYRQWEHIEVVG